MVRRPRRSADSDGRILPLINVVFLLLTFFMVAGRLAPPDPFALVPPRSEAEGRPARGVVVVLAADGRLAVNGTSVEPPALTEVVRAARAANPESVVSLRVDGAASGGRLVAVLAALRAAGVEDARLATLRRAR
jgi:biopolymer transport protein ExbD